MPVWLWVLVGFFSGSLMFSAWLPKWFCGVDVCQKAKDKNPGVSNAMTQAGIPIGVLCLLCDLAKGIIPVVLALKHMPPRIPLFSLVLLSPVAGHAFSPFRRFRGGKAITVSFGVLLGAGRVFPGVWILAAWYLFFLSWCGFAPIAFGLVSRMSLWPVCRPFLAGCWGIAAIVCLKHFREARTSQGSLSFLHRSLTWDSHSEGHR